MQQIETLCFESIGTNDWTRLQIADLAAKRGVVAAIESHQNCLSAACGGGVISLHVNVSSDGAAHFPVSRFLSGSTVY